MQFLVDQLDQLDLALDQLATYDRNCDRFAFMLIDNVVELTLFEFVQEEKAIARLGGPKLSGRGVLPDGLERYFDKKVSFAVQQQVLSQSSADTIRSLHEFRNIVYHGGARHESVLHQLAVLYLKMCCSLLAKFERKVLMRVSTGKEIPYRVRKYLGLEHFSSFLKFRDQYKAVLIRISGIADMLNYDIFTELLADVESLIKSVDNDIEYITLSKIVANDRTSVVIECQARELLFREKTKKVVSKLGPPQFSTVDECVKWLVVYYPGIIRSDPVPSWRRRLIALRSERDEQVFFKKYYELVKAAKPLFELMREYAEVVDAAVEEQVESMRCPR